MTGSRSRDNSELSRGSAITLGHKAGEVGPFRSSGYSEETWQEPLRAHLWHTCPRVINHLPRVWVYPAGNKPHRSGLGPRDQLHLCTLLLARPWRKLLLDTSWAWTVPWEHISGQQLWTWHPPGLSPWAHSPRWAARTMCPPRPQQGETCSLFQGTVLGSSVYRTWNKTAILS